MTDPSDTQNDYQKKWYELVVHIMEELKEELSEVRKDLKEHSRDLTTARIEIGMLKVKSGVWGAIGGSIPLIVVLALWAMKSYLSSQ